MVLLFGGHHHQQPVRADALLAQLDRPVHARLADGHGRDADVVDVDALFRAALPEPVAAQVGQHLLGIAELRHQVGVAEVGDLDVLAAGKYHLLGVEDLGPGGNELFQVLKAVPDRDVAERHFSGHSRENFPIIVFGHDFFPFLQIVAFDNDWVIVSCLRVSKGSRGQGVKINIESFSLNPCTPDPEPLNP